MTQMTMNFLGKVGEIDLIVRNNTSNMAPPYKNLLKHIWTGSGDTRWESKNR